MTFKAVISGFWLLCECVTKRRKCLPSSLYHAEVFSHYVLTLAGLACDTMWNMAAIMQTRVIGPVVGLCDYMYDIKEYDSIFSMTRELWMAVYRMVSALDAVSQIHFHGKGHMDQLRDQESKL